MSTVKVTIPLGQTGVVAVRLHDECKELIEARVAELFAERFPPGSDGPLEGFDIGALYMQAACELAQKIETEIHAAIQRDMDRFISQEDGEA